MGRFSVFGLGYVGSTMTAALAAHGHHVVGVDPDAKKRRIVEEGGSPVGEPGIAERIADGRDRGLISVTADAGEALAKSEIAFVCVGTPSTPDGTIDLGAVTKVTREIAAARPAGTGIVYRSTMVPGTMDDVVTPILGEGVEAAYYPEFMREGSAWDDYLHPPKVVVGARTPRIREALALTFPSVPTPVFWTDFRTAELVKYVDNAFHATKVTFANEIGILAQAFGVDAGELMRIFVSDRKLNISEAYLRPGFAFGGSCLAKDLRALTAWARGRGLPAPLLSGILASNEAQIARAVEVVKSKAGAGPAGFIGLAFKPGTDDLRESPFLAVAAALVEAGVPVIAHDPDVRFERLTGANLAHVRAVLPSLEGRLVAVEQVWSRSSVVVACRGSNLGTEAMVRDFVRRGGFVVDLARVESLRRWAGESYWCVA
ncbi:MAG: nucleotide sugar dehydrogenase [Planctomycetes bacterium]|nr:nucleotide sugar dehydrogenase [Planctomycetota bacterium]